MRAIILLLFVFILPNFVVAKRTSLEVFTHCVREKLMLGVHHAGKLELLCNSSALDIDVIIKRLQVTDNYYVMELDVMDSNRNIRIVFVSEGYGSGATLPATPNIQLVGPFGPSNMVGVFGGAATPTQQPPQVPSRPSTVNNLSWQQQQTLSPRSNAAQIQPAAPQPYMPAPVPAQIQPPQVQPFSDIPGCDGFGPHAPHCGYQ